MTDPKQQSLFDDTATYTSANTGQQEPLTLARLQEAKKLLDALSPDPLEKYMRDHGYPPERYDLILPVRMRFGIPYPPYFVKFSASTQIPLISLRPTLSFR